MARDKLIGGLILLGVTIAAIVYFGLIYLGFGFEVIAIVVSIGLLIILGIGGWIGWTMVTTPTPESTEDLDLDELDEFEEESGEPIESNREASNLKETSRELKSISGMTEARVESLRDAGFKDVESIRTASKDELLEVKGIGPKLAERIKKKFE